MGSIYAETLGDPETPGRLAAVASLDVGEHGELLDRLGVDRRFEQSDRLWEMEGLDGVVVATPTHTHADLVRRAARNGLDVYCEKPLALTLSATRRVIRTVRAAGVTLQVGFMRRFDRAYRSAKDAVEEGAIGRPVTFKSVGRDPGCPDPEFARPERSGGLLVDMAIHDFDLAAWLMDSPVERVHADGALRVCEELERVGDIDNAVVNLRMANGTLGNVEVSRNAVYGYDVRTEVLGSDGAVEVGPPRSGAVRTLDRRDAGRDDSYLEERFGPAYRAEIRHFVDCLRTGNSPRISGDEALAAFEVARAAQVSLDREEPVDVAALRNGQIPEPSG